MKTFVVILLFGATAFAQHAFTPEEITEGARLYQSNCTGCHGTAGDLVPGVSLMSGKIPARDERRRGRRNHSQGRVRHGDAGFQFLRAAGWNDRGLLEVLFSELHSQSGR